jgi:hypothetical protein
LIANGADVSPKDMKAQTLLEMTNHPANKHPASPADIPSNNFVSSNDVKATTFDDTKLFDGISAGLAGCLFAG